jgi:hypothetical protein
MVLKTGGPILLKTDTELRRRRDWLRKIEEARAARARQLAEQAERQRHAGPLSGGTGWLPIPGIPGYLMVGRDSGARRHGRRQTEKRTRPEEMERNEDVRRSIHPADAQKGGTETPDRLKIIAPTRSREVALRAGTPEVDQNVEDTTPPVPTCRLQETDGMNLLIPFTPGWPHLNCSVVAAFDCSVTTIPDISPPTIGALTHFALLASLRKQGGRTLMTCIQYAFGQSM